MKLIESEVEAVGLEWLECLGEHVPHGPDTVPDSSTAERANDGEVVLGRRLHDALARLNPELHASVLDDAFRTLTRPEGATPEARNRAFHHPLMDGVTVEHRIDGGAVRRAQARVIDFDQTTDNNWLAVNQFTVVENNHERRPDAVLFVN